MKLEELKCMEEADGQGKVCFHSSSLGKGRKCVVKDVRINNLGKGGN